MNCQMTFWQNYVVCVTLGVFLFAGFWMLWFFVTHDD